MGIALLPTMKNSGLIGMMLNSWLLAITTIACSSHPAIGTHDAGAGGPGRVVNSGVAGHSSAGSGGAGGTTGGTGGSGGSGAGSAGSPQCGPCPTYACAEPLQLTVSADGDAGAGVIAGLKADAPGLTIDCSANGGAACQWHCQSSKQIADGNYAITLSAPGYDSVSLDVHAISPTDCGCCGCCPFSYNKAVVLHATGAPITGCCADLQSDSNNCGACGRVCPMSESCTAGRCAAGFSQCLIEGGGFASCTAYCASLKQVCSASCTQDFQHYNVAMQQWLGNSGCSALSSKPTTGACDDLFQKQPISGNVPTYECCCGDP